MFQQCEVRLKLTIILPLAESTLTGLRQECVADTHSPKTVRMTAVYMQQCVWLTESLFDAQAVCIIVHRRALLLKTTHGLACAKQVQVSNAKGGSAKQGFWQNAWWVSTVQEIEDDGAVVCLSDATPVYPEGEEWAVERDNLRAGHPQEASGFGMLDLTHAPAAVPKSAWRSAPCLV